MKRAADYLIETLYDAGAQHMFFVPGSGCMYLIDALARKKELTAINMNHEQAAGMAALAYAQAKRSIGACIVTTGCGGTNALTALLHAWQDGIPCIFLSGQAERNHTIRNSTVALRQLGRQEADIVEIVSSITKYAVMINDPDELVFETEKALHIATSGRMGPVWIDIPLDIQGMAIETEKTRHFIPEEGIPAVGSEDILKVKEAIESSRRPIILAGGGIHASRAERELAEFIEKYRIPLVHSRLGCDLLASDSEYSIGMIGMLGASRSGNFAIQNSDLVLCIGCRLSINTTGYEYADFARNAKIIVVDIDEEEHKKGTVRIDHFIFSDAKRFLRRLLEEQLNYHDGGWLEKCRHWKQILPIVPEEYKSTDKIDMYDLADQLSAVMPDDAIVVSDAGDGYYIGTTGIRYKSGQMAITSGAQAEMGFALPGAIGAYYATKRPIIVFVGDGSLMMNLQELATVAFYQIPLKIIVINNNGYSCIRKLHMDTFRRYVGCDPRGGLALPDFEKVADCFGLAFLRIDRKDRLKETLAEAFADDRAVLCEAMCTEKQQFLSVVVAKNQKGRFAPVPLENQAPFMDEEMLKREMVSDATG